MKRIALMTATTLMLATSASAGGFAFSLPNLSFPPASDVTVGKDCLPTNTTSGVCVLQE